MTLYCIKYTSIYGWKSNSKTYNGDNHFIMEIAIYSIGEYKSNYH